MPDWKSLKAKSYFVCIVWRNNLPQVIINGIQFFGKFYGVRDRSQSIRFNRWRFSTLLKSEYSSFIFMVKIKWPIGKIKDVQNWTIKQQRTEWLDRERSQQLEVGKKFVAYHLHRTAHKPRIICFELRNTCFCIYQTCLHSLIWIDNFCYSEWYKSILMNQEKCITVRAGKYLEKKRAKQLIS